LADDTSLYHSQTIHAAERGSEYLREFKITRKSIYGSVLSASALGNF
jgi:hypothetical protein